jgi:cholecystokinin-like receptor
MSILDIANEMIRETKSHLNDCIRNSMFTTIDLTISSLLENSTITFELINTTSIPTTEIIKSSSNQTSLSIIIRIIAYTIIFIAALIGNISVLITLIFTRRLRTVTNAFLTNLAISDLLLGIFCMPFTLAGSISRNFMFGPLMCKLIPYFQGIY